MWMLFYIVNEPVLISAHAEEIVGLFDYFRFCLVIGTLAFYQFSFSIESFTSKTIEPLIITEVYVIPLFNFVEDQFYGLLMARVSCPNKVVVGDIQFGPQDPEEVAHAIHVFARGLPRFLSSGNDFVSMFIRTCEKVWV